MPEPELELQMRTVALRLVREQVERMIDELGDSDLAALHRLEEAANTPAAPGYDPLGAGVQLRDLSGFIQAPDGYCVGFYDRFERNWNLAGEPFGAVPASHGRRSFRYPV